MTMHDAEEYTISIRLESIEGERLYVARVDELPDVEEYADSYEFARQLALDTIRITQKLFRDKGVPFPSPKVFAATEVSGRVTLRLPKSLHATCVKNSEEDDVSLNSYLITCIASYVGGRSEKMVPTIELQSSLTQRIAVIESVMLQNKSSQQHERRSDFNAAFETRGAVSKVRFETQVPDLLVSCTDIAASFHNPRLKNA